MWQATLESANFVFEAYGASKGDAMAMLRLGLEKHAHQCGIAADWWAGYDVNVRYIARGECYRDRELLREAS